MTKSKQMSDSIRLGILLSLSGGFMDAYSYIMRDHVFANAQTGNMILLGINLAKKNFHLAFRYFLPILSFGIGIAIAEIIRLHINKHFHWRQICVVFEALILLCVAFIPLNYNLIANSLTSFACGIQVQSFRKIHNNAISTTMCIGNMRSGTQNLYLFFHHKEKNYLNKALLYYFIIICFVIGAIVGDEFIQIFNTKAILFCCILLVISFAFMFADNEKNINSDKKENTNA